MTNQPRPLPRATACLLGLAFVVGSVGLMVVRFADWLGGGMMMLAVLLALWARILQAGVHHAEMMAAVTQNQRTTARGWRA